MIRIKSKQLRFASEQTKYGKGRGERFFSRKGACEPDQTLFHIEDG